VQLPAVAGTIQTVSPSQINILAPAPCGHVNVTYSGSTQIVYNGYTLSAGTYVNVYGTGSCSTSFTATELFLGTATPTPAPTPSPTPTGVPALTATIQTVSPTKLNVLGPAPCGHVNVTYGSTTQIVYNGYTLAAGTVVNIYGTGSCATSFTATALVLGTLPTPSPTPTATPTPSPTSPPLLTATIQSVTDSQLKVLAPAPCGHVNVNYGPTTQINYYGYTLAPNVIVNVWGSGSCATSFTATIMTLGVLPNPTPTPSPPPVNNPLSHVQTFDYCCGGYSNDTPTGGVATAKPWISYYAAPSANGDPSGTNPTYGAPGLQAAGIPASRVYTYIDDSHVYSGDAQFSNVAPGGIDASAEAKTCAGAAITEKSGAGYLTDPWQPATLTLYDNDVTTQYNYSTEFGMVFIDDMNAYIYNDNSAMPCHNGAQWSQPTASAAYATIVNSMTVANLLAGHPAPAYMLNVLSPIEIEASGSIPSMSSMITSFSGLANVMGFTCDECLADNKNAIIGQNTATEMKNQWSMTENAEIATVNTRKLYVLLDQDSSSRGTYSYAGRTYAFASFMLAWDPVYTGYQTAYYGFPGNGTNPNSANPQIHVFPEEALTAYNPIVPYPSTSTGAAAFQDTGGAFFREYQSCFYNGTAIGGCAFIVNPNASSVGTPSLKGTYTHTMVISSENSVLDGGTVSLTGASVPSSIPALAGYILLP
jgi:hypothetical protein